MLFGVIKIIGVAVFLYLTWRNLNENYKDDLLISYSWLNILAFGVCGRLVFGLLNWGVWNESFKDWLMFWQMPGFSYWGGVLGMMCMTWWFCDKYSWKLWSLLEDMVGTIYLFIGFLLAGELWVANFDIRIFVYVILTLIGYIVSGQISQRYRSLVWYKSGKKGFVFFFTNSLVLFLFALQSIFYKDRPTIWISYLAVSLISLTGLFILGEVFVNLELFSKRRNNGKNR